MEKTIGNKKNLIMLIAVVGIMLFFAVVFYMDKDNTNSTEAESSQLMEDYTTTKSFVEQVKMTIVDLESQSLDVTEQQQKLMDAKERIQAFEPPQSFSVLHHELFTTYKNGMIQAIEKQLQNPSIDHAVLVNEIEQAVASWSVLEVYILEDLYIYSE